MEPGGAGVPQLGGFRNRFAGSTAVDYSPNRRGLWLVHFLLPQIP